MSLRPLRRALLSVSDKHGLLDLARGLAARGVELISTGGTRHALAAAGLAVRDITDLTGFPEMMGGRVKTLHPRVHGGLLAVRDDAGHVAAMSDHGILPIDLVVCNLYPFERTVATPGVAHHDVVENIDIGGPAMIRSAAKNHADVAVVVEPAQYAALLAELADHDGQTTLPFRERLAAAAFARTAAYDAAIAAYFAPRAGDDWPARLTLPLTLKLPLRYGENPHQRAALYVEPGAAGAGVATAEQLHGKELSYNNLLDLDSALNLAREFAEPAVVVVKHNNPCGTAIAPTLAEAFAKAYDGDPLSAFGGVFAFNRPVDEPTAFALTEPNRFVEAIIAPDFDAAAIALLTTRPKWAKNVRLLRTGPLDAAAASLDYRRVDGGLLVQSRDRGLDSFAHTKCVTKREPTAAELADLRFAWAVVKHVKSNAIVLAKGGQLLGTGAGQMSRVDSVDIAVRKAGDRARGAVLASDAFFPFRDNVDRAAPAGVAAVVQPGGSVRDAESVAACDEFGLAMLFTGVRHFRH